METKLCPACGETKAVADFVSSGAKKYGYCKPCHHDKQRAYRLRTLFNLTPAEYDKMFDHQGGVCFICYRPPKKQRLNVDHDHKSGLVRGLLCYSCNLSLGRFCDDVDRLERAVQYLKTPPATEALGEQRIGRIGRTTNRRGKPTSRKKRSAT